MAVACNPTLLNSVGCLSCLAPGQLQLIQTYLLLQISGMALNIQTLLTGAGCLECLTPGQHQLIQTYLLCQILNNGGGGGGPIQVYNDPVRPAAPSDPTKAAIWYPPAGGPISEWTGAAWV